MAYSPRAVKFGLDFFTRSFAGMTAQRLWLLAQRGTNQKSGQ
jgi:hypothetical protein